MPLLDALKGKNKGRPPVWFMRQAGRYMPEYQAIRKKHSFLEMCHTPEIIAEVTMQPVNALGVDAAILFSDILVIPEALKVGLRFEDAVGPIIERPLSTAADIDSLPKINIPEALRYVEKGIKLLKPQLKVPLLGFCGAPFTVASYMIEGKSSKDLHKTKKWMLSDPASFHRLLDILADSAIKYLEMQVNAGVDAVQIFDSWAGFLAYPQFNEFSLAYLKKITDAIKPKVPVILFCRGTSSYTSEMAKIAPNAISVDWNARLTDLRRQIPSTITLQGNLDPDILYAPLDVVKRESNRLLSDMKGDPAYIFNLGHGITPGTPVDAVKAVVDCVRASS